MLPSAFAPGAVDVHISYLGELTITADHLLDHFGPAWEQVIKLNAAITAIPIETLFARAREVAVVKTASRNKAWTIARDEAQQRGRLGQWRDAQEVFGLYMQGWLTNPERPLAVDDAQSWEKVDTIGQDALAATDLGDLASADELLATQLDVLSTPWRVVRNPATTTNPVQRSRRHDSNSAPR